MFIPIAGNGLVREAAVEFEWHPGFARIQNSKSINSLHEAAADAGITAPLLEVSTKSPARVGIALSAFNLAIDSTETDNPMLIEAAFEGSKVFAETGQHPDLYHVPDGREIKRRIKELGLDKIVAFRFEARDWELEPKTAFYDWLYLRGLTRLMGQDPSLDEQLTDYRGFTDIEFNPAKSINCQARSCALYCSLVGLLGSPSDVHDLVNDPDDFVETLVGHGYGGQPDATETLF